MRKILALLLCLALPAYGQEQVCWNVSPPVVLCNGGDGPGHADVYAAPPAWAGWLPLQIASAMVFYNGDAPAGGQISIALDPGGIFISQSGYPLTQNGDTQRVIQLAHLVTKPYQPQKNRQEFTPPVVWHSGDKLFTNYACYSPPGSGAGALQMGWQLCFIKP